MRALAMVYFYLCCHTRYGVSVRMEPKAAWGFESAYETSNFDTSSLFLTVGSDVVLAEDNDISSPGNRFALFGEHGTSKLTLYEPLSMDISEHFGLLFYLRYDVFDALETADGAGFRVVFDSGVRLLCQNGVFQGEETVPGMQILAGYDGGYKVSFGDYRSCVQRTVHQTAKIGTGWKRHIVHVKRDGFSRCTASLSDPTSSNEGEDYFTGPAIECPEFFSEASLPATIGDGAYSSGNTADNFVGGLACIQFYNKNILPFSDSDHELCDHRETTQQKHFFDFGPGIVPSNDNTITTTTTALTTTTTTPATTTSTTQTTTTAAATTTTSAAATTTTTTAATTTTPTTSTTSAHTTTELQDDSCNECCYCSCASSQNTNISGSQVQQIVDDIVDTLIIDKQSTSQEKRKKTSAQDDRQSAQVLATLGIGLCTVVGALVIGLDLMTICRKTAGASCC